MKQNNYENHFLMIDRTNSSPTVFFKDTTHRFSISHPQSRILQLLLERQETVSKEELLSAGWGRTEHLSEGSLPVAISNLRRTLKTVNVDIINTPGIGYRIKLPEQDLQIHAHPQKEVISSVSLHPFNTLKLLCCVGFSLVIVTVILLLINTLSSWVYVSCGRVSDYEVCRMEGVVYEINYN